MRWSPRRRCRAHVGGGAAAMAIGAIDCDIDSRRLVIPVASDFPCCLLRFTVDARVEGFSPTFIWPAFVFSLLSSSVHAARVRSQL